MFRPYNLCTSHTESHVTISTETRRLSTSASIRQPGPMGTVTASTTRDPPGHPHETGPARRHTHLPTIPANSESQLQYVYHITPRNH